MKAGLTMTKDDDHASKSVFILGNLDMNTLANLFERHEIFFFEPRNEAGESTGPECRFDMTAMREHIESLPGFAPVPVMLHQQLYDHVVNNNGVEEAKIRRLSNRPDIYCSPVILLEWDDGSHVLADGNHRFCILWRMGIRRIPAYIVPPAIWRQFQIA